MNRARRSNQRSGHRRCEVGKRDEAAAKTAASDGASISSSVGPRKHVVSLRKPDREKRDQADQGDQGEENRGDRADDDERRLFALALNDIPSV